MRRFVLLALLVGVGVMTWRLGSALSSDALGMAVGVVFGVLAGIPTALLVLATNSRRRAQEDEEPKARHCRGTGRIMCPTTRSTRGNPRRAASAATESWGSGKSGLNRGSLCTGEERSQGRCGGLRCRPDVPGTAWVTPSCGRPHHH